jgi:RNA polymerase sigma-70 factor, ECF subfamily
MLSAPRVADAVVPSAEELYRLYSRQIYLCLYSRLKEAELAEDLMQETFYRVCKALPTMQGPLQALPWLYRIATNVAFDTLRHGRKITWQSLELREQERAADSPEMVSPDPADQVIAATSMQTALDLLPAGYRQALLLNVYKGYNGVQIAHALGIAPSGGKMYLLRARRLFKHYYQAFAQGDGDHPSGGKA